MKTYYFIIFLLAASFIQCFEAQAINKVKIVTIGGGFGAVYTDANRNDRTLGSFGQLNADDIRSEPQKIVDRMIEYWRRELNKVLIHTPDLILVTEFCDDPLGLTREERTDYYKVRGNQIHDFFASMAKANRCYIAFGTKREDNGGWWNSIVVLDREGKVAGIYNKNYPTMGEMNGGIRASNETPIIQCDFGTVAGALCFDLNFDELRDRYAALKPDILLFSSWWHGGLEQGKWAYTCRSYFVCSYAFQTFRSEIRNPFGEVIATSTHNLNYAVATVNLDRQIIHQDRNLVKIVELKKKYGDKVIIADQGEIGVLMISSEHERISAADMVKEFDIELLDNYLERAKQIRLQQLAN